MKLRRYIFLFLIVFLGFLVGCKNVSNKIYDDYMSITISKMLKLNKEYDIPYNDSDFETTIYEYNLKDNELKKIFSYPQNTFYPLGIYDKEAKVVYYAKENGNDSFSRKEVGDQIYAYNLETKEDKMLTDNLYAINKIVPVENYLFFIAAFDDMPNLVLGRVNLEDGQVIRWNEEKNLSTKRLAVDKINRRIYVAIYDEEIDYKNMLEGKGPATNTIYSFDFDFNDKKEILKIDDRYINALSVMDNKLLYCANKSIIDSPNVDSLVEVIDLSNNEVIYNFKENFADGAYIAGDLSGIYIPMVNGNSVYFYDFARKKYEPILNPNKDLGDIVNFRLFNK